MKQKLQGIIAGTLIGSMFTAGVAFAKSGTETLEVVYDNIKIVIDGRQCDPKDADGVSVEPFIYNGTTYLPARAVAEALGKNVSWDGEQSTVKIDTISDGDITEDELKAAFENKLLKDGTLQEYSFDRIDTAGTNTWHISFNVLPKDGEEQKWFAGNGEAGENGWIMKKGLYVYAVKTDGAVKLDILGTGL